MANPLFLAAALSRLITVTCPHCGVDIAAMNAEYESAVAELERVLAVESRKQKAESRNL